jgi:hypothetical protein
MKDGRTAEAAASPVCLALQVGVGLATVAIVVLGLWPGPILELARLGALALMGG